MTVVCPVLPRAARRCQPVVDVSSTESTRRQESPSAVSVAMPVSSGVSLPSPDHTHTQAHVTPHEQT